MAHYVATVETSLAPAEAFARLADFTQLAAWDPGVRGVARTAPGSDHPLGVGATYRVTLATRPALHMTYRVERFEAGTLIALRARTLLLTSYDVITVAATAGGSVVTYDALLTLNGPLRHFDAALARRFQGIGDAAAAGLRQSLPPLARAA